MAPVSTRLRSVSETKKALPPVVVWRVARELRAPLVQVVPGGVRQEVQHIVHREAVERDRGRTVRAQQVPEDLGHRVRSVHVAVAIGRDHEQPRRMAAPEHVAQELDGRPGRPLQVVENEHERARRRRVGEPQGDGLVQPVTFGVGVGLERIVQPADPLRKLGDEPMEIAPEATEGKGLDVVDVVPERLRERLVRDREALVAPAEQDERGLVVELPGDLGHEPRLADTGFARQEARPPGTGLGVIPGGEEPGPLVVSADERELVATKEGRGQWSGRPGRLPQDLERGQGFGEPLQVERTHGDEARAGATPRQCPHRVAAEDLVPVGGVAQPCCLDDGHAVYVVPVDVHVADREPHADVEPGRVDRPPLCIDGALQRDGTFDRARRTLEDGHDPVAEAFDDRPVARFDAVAQQVVEGLSHPIGGGVTDRCSPPRRPHDICEQHGEEPGSGHGAS